MQSRSGELAKLDTRLLALATTPPPFASSVSTRPGKTYLASWSNAQLCERDLGRHRGARLISCSSIPPPSTCGETSPVYRSRSTPATTSFRHPRLPPIYSLFKSRGTKSWVRWSARVYCGLGLCCFGDGVDAGAGCLGRDRVAVVTGVRPRYPFCLPFRLPSNSPLFPLHFICRSFPLPFISSSLSFAIPTSFGSMRAIARLPSTFC